MAKESTIISFFVFFLLSLSGQFYSQQSGANNDSQPGNIEQLAAPASGSYLKKQEDTGGYGEADGRVYYTNEVASIIYNVACCHEFNIDAIKEQCNRDEDLLQRCSMALPVLSSPDISFALTREELDKSCIELRAGIKCIENYTNVCMEKHEQIVFKRIYAGIIDVVQELCTRGPYQDEYLKHADCVKNVRSEYETCSRKYEVTLTQLSNHQQSDQYQTDQSNSVINHEEYLRTVCCSFQEYLTCSEQTVQRSCGDEAALFTSAFLKRMASNIIKNFCLEYRGQECGLPDDANSVKHSLLLISGVSIVHLTLSGS